MHKRTRDFSNRMIVMRCNHAGTFVGGQPQRLDRPTTEPPKVCGARIGALRTKLPIIETIVRATGKKIGLVVLPLECRLDLLG
ncbi:hypothetical protein RvY_01985 [Ramazzottius varieornatus]|uniref:Uncharacterized protein n=1 Tax=Ramazzottius varieornatus TaxID=947166 RepID=A0A1D1UIA0_RAMVA|nr:hypothetical protein RvY_01985 [Ramazzottius varieornatus]